MRSPTEKKNFLKKLGSLHFFVSFFFFFSLGQKKGPGYYWEGGGHCEGGLGLSLLRSIEDMDRC